METSMEASGPLVIAYDRSPPADHAVREAGKLFPGRRALVLVVWKEGLGFEIAELPAATIGMPPSPLDIRTALEIDRVIYEGAQKVAQQGAELAKEAGLDAEGLAVADEVDVPLAETIAHVAEEQGAAAIVIGAQGQSRAAILGSTSRDVIGHARGPVVIVPGPEG
jgi:nucleotide-binding universal stress UspA family protein